MPTHTQVSPEETLEGFYTVPPWSGSVRAPPSRAESTRTPGAVPSAQRTAPPERLVVSERAPVTPSGAPSPVVCAVVSLFLPGVGQMMCGQLGKGAVVFGVAFCSLCLFGVMNVFAALDAYRIAERRVRGEVIADWQFF